MSFQSFDMKSSMKVNSQHLRFLLVAIGLAASGLSSCKKDVENTSPITIPTPTLVDVVSGAPNYTILRAAIQKTNLTGLLSSNSQFTLLAPNDAAFATLAAPYNSATTIAALNPAVTVDATQITVLQNILLNHVISGKFRAAELPTNGITTQRVPAATARRDNQIFFVRTGNTTSINTATGTVAITQPDLEATNGYVHGISTIITPATLTIGTTVTNAAASTNPNRQFVQLLAALSQQNTQAALQPIPAISILSLLNSDQTLPASNGKVVNYTVFAPTDAALTAYLQSQGYANLAAVPYPVLTALLQRHVVPSERVFGYELAAGRQLTNLAGGTLTIGGAGPFTVTSSTSTTAANIATTSTFATNGTVFAVDRVL